MTTYRLFDYVVSEENMVDYIDYHIYDIYGTNKNFVDDNFYMNHLTQQVSSYYGIKLKESNVSDNGTIYYDDEKGKPICELQKIA